MYTQKLDFALKRLEQAIKKKINDKIADSRQEISGLLIKIEEIKQEVILGQNEIKMLKSIIKETVSSLDELIVQVEKISV